MFIQINRENMIKNFTPNEKLENEILKLIDESHLYTRSDLQGLVAVLANKYIERETDEKTINN